MMKLGMPVPETWMVPPKSYDEHADLDTTLGRYAKMFDLGEIGDKIGYPMFMKPYDGGAWKGVNRIDNEDILRSTYEESGTYLMHLQQSVEGFDRFVRCIGLGPQFLLVSYDPSAPLHERYEMKLDFVNEEEKSLLEDMAMTINSFFGWDFNSCESLHRDGVWHPIDFANACPDSQVTSLHYFFPWIVMANVRWSIFCATTKRKMRMNQDWEPYWKIMRQDMPYRERLAAYAAIGHQRMETDRFREFCDQHLSPPGGANPRVFRYRPGKGDDSSKSCCTLSRTRSRIICRAFLGTDSTLATRLFREFDQPVLAEKPTYFNYDIAMNQSQHLDAATASLKDKTHW